MFIVRNTKSSLQFILLKWYTMVMTIISSSSSSSSSSSAFQVLCLVACYGLAPNVWRVFTKIFVNV